MGIPQTHFLTQGRSDAKEAKKSAKRGDWKGAINQ